nr:helix-turn-helix transcriptional regulator [Tessaracoccus bendigoensis]
MSVAQRLREARVAAGLTQAQLAARLGVADGTRVAAWEHGRATPHPATWAAICSLLDTDLEEPGEVTLRSLRLRRGLTPEDVAAELGVAAVTVRRWESGAHRPRARHAQRLAQLYGVATLLEMTERH